MRASIRATTDPARQSTDRRAFPRSAMPLCVRHSTCQRCLQCALIPPLQLLSPASRRRPPHAQADRRRGHAQASGYMFRCAEDRQAVRSGYRHASLSHSDFPYSVVRLETDHSAVPICQHVSRRAQRWSRRAAGPRTAVRLVLDFSEHADTLSQIQGCQNQHPTLDRQHGIYPDQRPLSWGRLTEGGPHDTLPS